MAEYSITGDQFHASQPPPLKMSWPCEVKAGHGYHGAGGMRWLCLLLLQDVYLDVMVLVVGGGLPPSAPTAGVLTAMLL